MYQYDRVWYDNAGELNFFLSAHLIITCWSSAGFTIHDPAIIKALGSVWLQLSWKRGKINVFGFWWSSTGTSVEKKLHVQLWNEGVMFFCHIFVCHSKLKQTTYGSVEQWGNLNETDKHIANISIVIKIKADRLRYMYIKICYFFHKNGIGMYKCTRKLQLHEKKI